MNTTELEHRLAEVLRQRAEDAMHSTDTQTRLEILHDGLDGELRNPRRARMALGLAAAAAVVVAALLVVEIRDNDRTGLPAGREDTQAAETVAARFMAALADYDAPRAAAYLADGARVEIRTGTQDATQMGPQLRWAQAAGWQPTAWRCAHERLSESGVEIACLFDVHMLGSEQLGRGPFTGNVLRLTVVDGEIVRGVEEWGSDRFEVTMWEPFTGWLLSNRVDEADDMFDDWPGAVRPALTARSARLWETNVARYVKAVQRGDAP